jgi:hypothetical protein
MALSGPKMFARPEYVPLWNSELNVWRSGFAGFLSRLAKSVRQRRSDLAPLAVRLLPADRPFQ